MVNETCEADPYFYQACAAEAILDEMLHKSTTYSYEFSSGTKLFRFWNVNPANEQTGNCTKN